MTLEDAGMSEEEVMAVRDRSLEEAYEDHDIGMVHLRARLEAHGFTVEDHGDDARHADEVLYGDDDPWKDEELLEWLYVEKDMSYKEVAEVLGCSAKTAGKHIKEHGIVGEKCPNCGEVYQQPARHWNGGGCEYPSFSKKHHEIITGLLMGDGCVSSSKHNPRLETQMTNREYLHYLDDQFGVFSSGIREGNTAEQEAERSRKRGFSENAQAENYSDLFGFQTCRHPEFNQYRQWYSSGEKVWPEDIELTPTVLKHWYCGDGSYQNASQKSGGRITIALSNEIGNKEKVSRYFRTASLPEPSNWDERKRSDGRWDCNIYWSQHETQELFDYMGEPLPGFEYKWPSEVSK